jgi:hypothetical protein
VLHKKVVQERTNYIEKKIIDELPLNKKKRFRIGFTRQIIKEKLYDRSVKSFRKLAANP